MAKTDILGPARNRVDGPLKVTGRAKYAVEFEVPGCVHSWPVVSNICKGTITAIDSKAAEAMPGVKVVHDGNFVGVTAPDILQAAPGLPSCG